MFDLRFLIHGVGRAFLGAALLCAAGVAARAQTPTPPPGPPAAVSVRFVALDKQDHFVEPLDAADIRLTAAGRAQAVTSLRRLSDLPLSLVVALDASVSQERVIEGAKLAADAFVAGVMRPGVDEFGVVAFTNEAKVEQPPTGDAALVRAAVARVRVVTPPGYVGGGVIAVPGGSRPPARPSFPGATAVWDAISQVSADLLGRAPAASRRALILITDGVDTASRRKLADAVEAALRADAVVYAVGLADEYSFDGVAKGDLRKLTERTGGRAFFPKQVDELSAIFRQVRAELLAPYVATFAPAGGAGGGAPRKLKLEVVNPELRRRGVRLVHPEAYFAR